MNLIHAKFLPPQWQTSIQPYKGSSVKSANQSSLHIVGVIRLCVRLGDLQVRVRFGVVRDLITRVLVGTPFIDKFVAGIFPPERRIVPKDSQPVPILDVDRPDMILAMTQDDSEDDYWQGLINGPPQLVSAATELQALQSTTDATVRVAKPMMLAPRSQQFVQVTCPVPGLVVITPHRTTKCGNIVDDGRGIP